MTIVSAVMSCLIPSTESISIKVAEQNRARPWKNEMPLRLSWFSI